VKMKVKVSKLQAAIHKFVEQDKKRFDRETTAYETAQKRAMEKYIENVGAYLAGLRDGKERIESYGLSDHLCRGCKFPSEPRKAETHVDLLVKLDLAEDEILVVDDHSDYMEFLSGKCVCH
jgi:hypothetical protein